MSDILRKQNRMMNMPALTAGQIPYGNSTVEDALDGLTEDTGWTQIGTSDYYYRKVGKVVWVKGSVAATNGSWVTPANLPSGYRPTSNLFETLLVNANSFCFD